MPVSALTVVDSRSNLFNGVAFLGREGDAGFLLRHAAVLLRHVGATLDVVAHLAGDLLALLGNL